MNTGAGGADSDLQSEVRAQLPCELREIAQLQRYRRGASSHDVIDRSNRDDIQVAGRTKLLDAPAERVRDLAGERLLTAAECSNEEARREGIGLRAGVLRLKSRRHCRDEGEQREDKA